MQSNRAYKYVVGQEIGNCIYLGDDFTIKDKSGQSRRHATFQCKCGRIFKSNVNNIKYGKTISCGCMRKERIINMSLTHGLSYSTERSIWNEMRQRCKNKNNERYNDYGGRGIKVCEEWDNDFMVFYTDMGERPSKKHSIERIDNNKGYSKENCKWATKKEQANNRRTNLIIEYKGESRTLTQWCDILNLDYNLMKNRIKRDGWTIEEAFTIPKERDNRYIKGFKRKVA